LSGHLLLQLSLDPLVFALGVPELAKLRLDVRFALGAESILSGDPRLDLREALLVGADHRHLLGDPALAFLQLGLGCGESRSARVELPGSDPHLGLHGAEVCTRNACLAFEL